MITQFFHQRLRVLVLIFTIITAPLCKISAGISEPGSQELSYVIIGAFAYQNNAIRFTDYAKQKSFDAQYAINPGRNLYYVYVFSSQNVQDAIREAQRLRSISEFHDAWVYTGTLGLNKAPEIVAEVKEEVEEEPMKVEPPVDEVKEEVVQETEEPAKENGIDKKEGYYYLYFNTINKKNLREVKGNVKIIDLERLKDLQEAKSQEIVKLADPHNGTSKVKFATDIFGFKEVQHEIDLDHPVNDTTAAFTRVVGDSIIVDFELERFKKGDVLVMYNVYFYIDAAIMKPESVYELNSFLDMLRENDKLKVRIHGHTNGNSHGKIIYMDPKNRSYFSLNAKHKESMGSAKKLSLYRAEAIKSWLLDQGIKEDRIETKGWGGKKMIYGKNDIQAYKNVRVEVEIVED